MKKLLTLLLLLMPLILPAQELEYKMEAGGYVGLCSYLGDANSKLFKDNGGLIGALLRFNLNPRMSIKTNLQMGHISGNSGDLYLPADATQGGATNAESVPVDFSNTLIDLGTQYEYSFFGYGMGNSFKGHKRLTPYVAGGLGLVVGTSYSAVGAYATLGVGVRYKFKPRWNIGAEWNVRFTTTDKIDNINKPYGIKGGMFKNKDGYTNTLVYISYDMFPKYRKCNN
jgi:hypothetical protein